MDTINGSIRILIADDSELMRTSIQSLLESRSGWVVCGVATDGTEAIAKAIELKPDVIVLDLSMPLLNGLAVAEHLGGKMPGSKILIVTEQDSRTLTYIEQQPGVSGCVMKSRLNRDLVPAIEAASKRRRDLDSAAGN